MVTSNEVLKTEILKKKKENDQNFIKLAMEASEAAMQKTLDRINEQIKEIKIDLGVIDDLQNKIDDHLSIASKLASVLPGL